MGIIRLICRSGFDINHSGFFSRFRWISFTSIRRYIWESLLRAHGKRRTDRSIGPAFSELDATTMIVMTFNLRFENDLDGENSWRARREIVVEVVKRYRPSILGTQEGMRGQLHYLTRELEDYCMHAPDRVWDDDTCQYPTLFYRRDEFEALEGEETWLSPTPSVHRSKGWDSAFPRMMSEGLFRDIEDGRNVRAAVVHLDHIGVSARREQARIAAERMKSHAGTPRILLGDFNDAPDSAAHRLLTAPDVGLVDSWRALNKPENEKSSTYHAFTGLPTAFRMDWALVSSDFHVIRSEVVRDHRGGRYPSDHFPYLVELGWASAGPDRTPRLPERR